MAKVGDAVVDNSLVDDDLEHDEVVDTGDAEALADDKDGKDKKDEAREADGEREELEIEIEGEEEPEPDQGALNDDDKDDKGAKDQPSQEKYSKNVIARIGREQRIAREATVRATAANQRALAAEAKSRAVQKDALDITEQALESHIKATSATLLKAKEDGKSEDEIKLQSELNKLESRKEAVAASKRNLDAEIEAAKRGSAADGPLPRAQEWMRRNKWFSDPRYQEQAGHTRLIDNALASEGYDKNSPEYYAELDRRIRRRLPEIVKLQQRQGNGGQENDDGSERQQQRQQRREPTGGVQRSAGGPGAGKGKVVLKSADLQNMRSFGLDPTNKEHQREYALNKMSGGH